MKKHFNLKALAAGVSALLMKLQYNSWAGGYDGMFKNRKYSAPEILSDTLARESALSQQKGLKILDVGIGTGLLSEQFKRINPSSHITGMDISQGMLDACKNKSVADEVLQLDFQSNVFPFADESFDIVASSGVFELLGRPDHVISEMGRVLKPGGAFSFTTYSDSKLGYLCKYHDPADIDTALEAAGLMLRERFRFHAFTEASVILFLPNPIYYHLNTGVKEVAAIIAQDEERAPLPFVMPADSHDIYAP